MLNSSLTGYWFTSRQQGTDFWQGVLTTKAPTTSSKALRCCTARSLNLLLALVVVVVTMAANAITGSAQPVTGCQDGWYDYAQQYTATSSAFYHPSGTCPIVGSASTYYGWVGVNGQIQAPSHFPGLGNPQDTLNHSLGWLEMGFTNPPGWIQVGWIAGCLVSACSPSPVGSLGLYDESYDLGTTPTTDVEYADGTLPFNSTVIVNVEFYPSYYPNINCWIISINYNLAIRFLCSGGRTWNWTSGAPAVGSETCVCDHVSTNEVEMPVTIYGASNPNTNNALRIKGAAGYVPWTQTLSTGGTAAYDERNCPNPSYCPSPSPAYYISAFNLSYKIEAYGNTS